MLYSCGYECCTVAGMNVVRKALNREKPGSNPLSAVSKLWQFLSFHRSLSYINEYLATDTDGYRNKQSSRSSCSVAECFQKIRNGFGMNRSARGEM